MHGQVMDRRHGQAVLQGRPMSAVIEGKEYAQLGAGVEQAATHGVLPHHVHDGTRRQAGGNRDPRFTRVRGLPRIRGNVIEPVPVHGDIGDRRVEMRGLGHADRAPRGQRRRRHIAPMRAIIIRELHQAIIRSNPQIAFAKRRLGQREDRVVILHAGNVLGQRAARGGLFGFVVARQIGTDDFPAHAAIRGFPQNFGGRV